ncbi:MAG: THUMP domain-containing protein, partial [Ferruginibacter sp.]
MNVFNNTSRIIVTCSNRLSPCLQQEMAALGFTPVRVFKTGVELQGTLQDCIKLNLNLFCASQVLFSIQEFEAANATELYNHLKNISWEDIIDAKGYFSITSNVTNDT